ncbi:probable nucleoside diphosphate kinase 5 isoform X1, partial [Tanacetum coccineum]
MNNSSSLANADLENERTLAIVKPDGVSGNGPVLIMVLEKTNAIADWRALIGPNDAHKAKVTHLDSIRAMCGQDLERNCVHGSDSHDSAAREISFFFTDFQFDPQIEWLLYGNLGYQMCFVEEIDDTSEARENKATS